MVPAFGSVGKLYLGARDHNLMASGPKHYYKTGIFIEILYIIEKKYNYLNRTMKEKDGQNVGRDVKKCHKIFLMEWSTLIV